MRKKILELFGMGGSKVSPTITKVKPNLKKTVRQTKSDEYSKRIRSLSDSEDKIRTGKKMMQEGQRARKKMVDTGRAFQFRSGTSYHPLGPGDKEKYGKQMKAAKPQKKFKTGKQLAKEKKEDDAIAKEFGIRFKKAGGGMMGRRFGMKKGTPFKKETNVDKIKKTFAPKKKKFPDLTGDGKVTFADILKGRGVINGKKKKKA